MTDWTASPSSPIYDGTALERDMARSRRLQARVAWAVLGEIGQALVLPFLPAKRVLDRVSRAQL